MKNSHLNSFSIIPLKQPVVLTDCHLEKETGIRSTGTTYRSQIFPPFGLSIHEETAYSAWTIEEITAQH